MKIFVWRDAYRVMYGSAVVVAVAETAEAARIMLRGRPCVSKYGFEPDSAAIVNIEREPDWERDIDEAIVFEWSE